MPEAKFCDASDLFRLIRMIKSDDEIARLRRACACNENAVQDMYRTAAAGLSELELSAEFYNQIGANRGLIGWQHLGSGRRSEGIFPATAKKLEQSSQRLEFLLIMNSLLRVLCASAMSYC